MARITSFSEGLEELKLDILIKIYEKAKTDILKQIKQSPDLNNRKERENLLNQIQVILKDLYTPTAKFLDDGIQVQKEIGFDSVDPSTNFSLTNPKATEFLASNFDDIENLAYDQVKGVLSNSYTDIRNQFNQSIREYKTEVLTEIASGQIKGYGAKKLQKIILDNFEAKGLEPAKKQIKGIVQSTLINSRMSAVVQRALENGHDLVKVSTHAKASPMCSPYQGMIVSITGQTPGYKTLSDILFKGDFRLGGGILHRSCRHSLTVYIE